MDSIHLFDLAGRQARWLSARQATVAANVANVDTPGYAGRDVEPFAEILDRTRLDLARTAPGHMATGGSTPGAPGTARSEVWEIKHSGNSVSMEQELMKAGETSRSYALNTAIVRAFHTMLTTAVKG